MTRYSKIVRINHTPENLFELVSDIERYPEFIKWIQGMSIEELSRSETLVSRIGTARVGFKGFSERMATRVDANSEARTIDVSLVRGPLRRLQNRWAFEAAETGTDVHFFVDFEFKNLLLRALAAANFELAVNRVMAAFITEADRRYRA